MNRKVYFKDGGLLSLSAELSESSTMAMLAYRKLLDFIEFELTDDEDADSEALDEFGDEDELELDEEDFDELEDEDLAMDEQELAEFDDWEDDEEEEHDGDDEWRDDYRR